MTSAQLAEHARRPLSRGNAPAGAHVGAAGGAACGDLIRVSVRVDGERIVDAGFDAHGCAAAIAAGSATMALVRDAELLEAARLGAAEIAAELGGLGASAMHAAHLACDALHRALGAAARASARLEFSPARTLVAMSGGVDSAVAALLVAADGRREAVGVTLELWSDPANDDERSCCSAAAVRAARELAHRLGMPHFSLDLRAEFRAGVVDPWLAMHAAGETPNPCVRCNGSVRLDGMLDVAERLGARELATGHYARTVAAGGTAGERAGEAFVRCAVDPDKDQAYMLAALHPRTVARLRFPLGEMRKADVRERARMAGLPVADKPDSQDLCFLAGTGRREFLARHGGLGERPGEIVDTAGRVMGRHRGQHEFTVGQRRGLGVGGGPPLYVLAKHADSNRVVVGPRELLRADRVALRDVTLHRPSTHVDAVRLRYRSRALPCRLVGESLELLEPAAGPAPGQLACLLEGDVVVGHGTIAVAA